MTTAGSIIGINGPVITVAQENGDFFVSERVRVGEGALAGEVVFLHAEPAPGIAVVQVYESTTGLRCGQKVYGTGKPLSIQLAPGIVGHIFDGIGRRLDADANEAPEKWQVHMRIKPGDTVVPGDIFAEVPETPSITYKAMVPHIPDSPLTVADCVPDGHCAIDEKILTLAGKNHTYSISLSQSQPVRVPRPVLRRLKLTRPLITGQRVIDSLFPIAKGGVAAIPGGFGTGKTMTQHQLARWCDADMIVYIGCGERGNEMAEVLEDFSRLIDPRTNQPLMARTVLIANTSDMPVAAREASIYTGLAIAEGYRDMGYHVAVMADSTSRWAEALRELSGRLGELPAEEGYPAYLAGRLSAFYERAGYTENLNGTEGSITIVGAVSPQGADFSEPMTQTTKRFVRCFWALDRRLAYARHFPAIDWNTSYSDYFTELLPFYISELSADFIQDRRRLLDILHEESRILEVVKLIGTEALPESQHFILQIAKEIRENFLAQNAYNPADAYTPLATQAEMAAHIARAWEAVMGHAH